MQDLLNKKLAIVVNDVTFFLSHRHNIAEAARKAGMQVTICSPAHPQVSEVRSLGFQHHEISLSRWSANPLQEIATVYSLFRAYREIRPDVVHHVTIKPVIYGSLAAKAAKVPAIVNAISGLGQVFTARGTKAALRRAIVKGLYRSALSGSRVRVIFQNRDDRAAFLKSDLVAEYKTTLIRGAGVALDTAAPTQKLPTTFSVLFASRLLREKGIEEFIQAAALLRARGLKIRFQVAGEPVPGNPGSISPELFSRWKSERLLEFLGHRSDMPQLIKDSSVVCLPSYYGEGIPKILIEAAAAGRAIVTTDWPGCRDIVSDGDNGLLVPPRDSAALADAIENLARNPELCRKLGARGRERVAQEGFDENTVVQQTLALYQELLVSRGRAV